MILLRKMRRPLPAFCQENLWVALHSFLAFGRETFNQLMTTARSVPLTPGTHPMHQGLNSWNPTRVWC